LPNFFIEIPLEESGSSKIPWCSHMRRSKREKQTHGPARKEVSFFATPLSLVKRDEKNNRLTRWERATWAG
jgi:hypothetical protein